MPASLASGPDRRLTFCGRLDHPGAAHDRPDLLDWSRNPPSIDQDRIVDVLARADLVGRRILHVGVGSSGLARRLARPDRWIDGITVDPHERALADALRLPNYLVAVVNKYSPQAASLPGPYDFLVDNNPGSYACCLHHFDLMWRQYCALLKPGGQLLTDVHGLNWTPAGNEAWRMNVAELYDICARFPLELRPITDTVYALQRR